MKKVVKILIICLLILFFIISVVSFMFLFVLCPPNGPWPMPPWCKSYESKSYDLTVQSQKISFIPAFSMSDTWGRNYNFGMSGVTWKNIESNFDRLQSLGSKEVYVHDFHMAKYSGEENFDSLNYEIVDETFWNDFRDESIKQKYLNQLAEEAHKRGMKIGYKNNLAFVNIGKYLTSTDIESEVNTDFKNFNKFHSDEWTIDFFKKWKARMLEKSEMLNEAGFDIMSITPTWMGPEFRTNEKLANELWNDLISEVKNNFKGEVHVIVDRYGFLQDESLPDTQYEDYKYYDYYKQADIIEYDIYNLLENYQNQDISNENIKLQINKMLDDIEKKAKAKNIKISILTGFFSYPNSINLGIIEALDILNPKIKNMQSDFEHQKNIYENFLESVNNRQNINRVIVSGYWWDDAMDPEVSVRISLMTSVRNKPSEEIIQFWFKK